MGQVIVIEFTTVDGIVEDPDGRGGMPGGGWAFRHGPEAVAGDKFRLGASLDGGTMLLGRRTWERFAGIWPTRTDPFAVRMNAVPKVVASRGRPDVSAWTNSRPMDGALEQVVKDLRDGGDVIVAGSISIVHQLASQDLVDQYRLLTFPTVLGSGTRLFGEGTTPRDLALADVQPGGPVALATYQVLRA